MDRSLGVEMRTATGGLGVDAVDRVDAHEAPVLLAALGRARDASDAVARAQPEASDMAGADVDVIRAGHEAAASHEAVAIVDDVEDAGDVLLAAALALALHDALDELLLAQPVGAGDLQVAADADELIDVLAIEFLDIHGTWFLEPLVGPRRVVARNSR